MSDIPVEVWQLIHKISGSPVLLHVSRRTYAACKLSSTLMITVTAGRVLHGGMYGWFRKHHAPHVQHLRIRYEIPRWFGTSSGRMLACLSSCAKLSELTLRVSDQHMPVRALGETLRGLTQLQALAVTFSMQNDVTGISLRGVLEAGMRCERFHLGLKMCEVTDEAMHAIAATVAHYRPRWRELRMGLKHNFITDAGFDALRSAITTVTTLECLHVDLSYNRLQPSRCAALLGLPSLRRCTLKIDGDVFQMAPFDLECAPSARMEAVRLSAAFCAPVFPPGFTFGQGRLRSLHLDFEGCNFIGRTLSCLVQGLQGPMRHSLESLSLVLSMCNIGNATLAELLEQGIAALERLHTLHLMAMCADLWGDPVDAALERLPRTLRRLRLDTGCVRTFRCRGLRNLTALETVSLYIHQCIIETLELPEGLANGTIHVSDARVESLSIPRSVQRLELEVMQTHLATDLRLNHCTHLSDLVVRAKRISPVNTGMVLRAVAAAPPPSRLELDVAGNTEVVALYTTLAHIVTAFHATLTCVNLALTVHRADPEIVAVTSALAAVGTLQDLTLTIFTASTSTSKCTPAALEGIPSVARLVLDVAHLRMIDGCVAALARAAKLHAAAGRFVRLSVHSRNIDGDGVSALSELINLPLCAVHIVPGPFMPQDVVALILLGNLF